MAGFMIGSFAWFSANIGMKTRIHYLSKCLEKDADFYDQNNPNEMASKIAKQVETIQRGVGDKLGQIVFALVGFIMSYVVGIWMGWKYALLLCATLPILLAIGALFGMVMESGVSEAMKAYSQSSGYAEQALQGIKVVHTYGNEILETMNYDKYLIRARKSSGRQNVKMAGGFAFLMSFFFLFYAFALYVGGRFRVDNIKTSENGKVYSAGQIIAIMFCVLFGAFGLGAGAPHFKAVQEGKVAGKMAYAVMDHKP